METDGYLAVRQIHCGDARALLRRLRPESVSLSFWSPPYFVGKSYEADMSFNDWQALLAEVIRLHFPALVPGGFLTINFSDILCFRDPQMPKIQAEVLSARKSPVTREMVLAAHRNHPDYNRYQLAALLGCSEQTIDRRLRGNNIRGGKHSDQTRIKITGGMIEEWGSAAGFYLYDRRVWVKDPCWEKSRWHSVSYRAVDEFEHIYVFWKPGITVINRKRLTSREWVDWGSRGVWRIPSVRVNDDHEAKFPLELARRVIQLFSAPGELVLDPFVGSGTTMIAAIQTGRCYVGFDIVPKYAALAAKNSSLAEMVGEDVSCAH